MIHLDLAQAFVQPKQQTVCEILNCFSCTKLSKTLFFAIRESVKLKSIGNLNIDFVLYTFQCSEKHSALCEWHSIKTISVSTFTVFYISAIKENPDLSLLFAIRITQIITRCYICRLYAEYYEKVLFFLLLRNVVALLL